MAQWGQGQQYPMQTGFPGANPQFQQNPQFQPQNPQFQQQNPQFQQQQQAPQFLQGGLGIPNGGGLLPQQTGFPPQRQQGFQQPQQTGFQGGSGFIQSQPTGFPGNNFQQQGRPAPPPVPPIPSQFQQPNQPSFLSMPPPQPNRLLSASPGFGGGGLAPQLTGFPGRSPGPLVPQMTGFVDPRLQMMSQTFMPMNTSAPYGAGGAPQLPQQQQNLVQSIQQYNQAQRGSTNQQMPWALNKQEKKNYDRIFRSWDNQNSGFITGAAALEVFGESGLPKDDLARIWTLADINDRGKLNIAEFHVAMGLIYRRINGMPVPDQLPPELVPPSVADLDSTVDRVKELLKSDTRSGSSNKHSFNGASPSPIDNRRDASNYKHSDSEPPGGFFKPSNRHVDRSAIRSRNDDSPASDLSDMKRQLENTAQMLDRNAEADASRTKEDEELDQEMEDLKYRVKRVRDDLDYVARGPKTASKEEERRRLERELLSIMHERIPEVERKIKARDERKEKEKRQWARDRDRANDRFGRYDSRDDYSRRNDHLDRPYSRGGDRDRPYSRGDDRDRPYSRGGDDRDRSSRGNYDDDRGSYRRDRSRSRDRDGRDRGYDRPRSPPAATRSPAPPAPPAALSPAVSTAPASPSTPTPSMKSMTPAERQAFARQEAQRRIQERMAKLGVTAPSASPAIDTSVEDRLQQEKKEAEEKAKAAEKQAQERERTRNERLANEKALQDERTTPAPPIPTPTATAAPPAPTPTATPKAAPPPPKSRAPAPPPPRRAAAAPPPSRPAVSIPAPKPPAPVPAPPSEPEIDPEEEALRAREDRLRKQREERVARMRQLEKEEEEETARYEQERKARLEALRAKAAKPPTPPPEAPPVRRAPAPVVNAPSPPAPRALAGPASAPALSPAADKSTNPFSRLIKEGATTPSSPPTTNGNGDTNPWARPQTAPPPSVRQPSKSPAPNTVKTGYQTAPSAIDSDWEDVKENDESDDSSDDEITQSRSVRANIAAQLFGGRLPRPASAAGGASGPGSSPSSPAPSGAAPPPPPPPPPSAPPAPRAPAVAVSIVAPAPTGDVNALMRSIQGGLSLRPTKTVDKSAPPVSGKVLGDTAPPAHINNAPRPVSPPRAPTPPQAYPEPVPMSHDNGGRSSNRQSVGWFADRAADLGTSPVDVQRLPSTAEDEEEDMYAPETYEAPPAPAPVPQIKVDEPSPEPMSDLMADIDKSIQHRVRSLYAYEGDGPEDLSFGENLVIVANPSKSGGDWWYGTTVNTGKSGLFPKNYVEVVTPVKAKAVFTYSGGNPDELSFDEGETLSIVDMSEEEWWKAEQGGVILIVPAAYLEIVEEPAKGEVKSKPIVPRIPIPQPENIPTPIATDDLDRSIADDDDSDSDNSDSDYLSFDETDNEESATNKEARERERQLVLEAAGLIVNQNVGPPPTRVRSIKRRPAPAAPQRTQSVHKDLPPVPEAEPSPEVEPEIEDISHEARLDDAFARYESFKNTQANLNRLSVVSTDSSIMPSSPTATISSMSMASPVQTNAGGHPGGEGKYSHFLNFLTRSKTPDGERRTASTLNISAPIMNVSSSQSALQDGPSRSNSPAFGMSWASLVNKDALEGIPPGERKRQEAIFELINTEVAYVRDLQLIVEVFYSSMVSLLSTKEVTVVFANIEDLLLTNTAFVSSLEERQKDCRLYIDRIGDILLTHIPNMGAYMQYCVNQSTAINVLKSLRDSNPQLASHLQQLRDENPTTRNLDLSSYLLAPMQRITRYPLLIKQILQYTELGEEYQGIRTAIDMAEKLLEHINETIRDQEGHETLKKISQNLWIGQGRLDLTAPTRFMGQRRLIKQGVLMKAKSGKKLHAFLCSDILVLVDESMRNLYRMPIPLAHAQVKESGSKDDTTFQISQPYPRGGDSVSLRASSARDCQQWTNEIGSAGKRARHAEEKTARKAGRR